MIQLEMFWMRHGRDAVFAVGGLVAGLLLTVVF